MELQRTPLLRLVLPFILGILSNYYFKLPLNSIFIGLVSVFLIFNYFILANKKINGLLSVSKWASVPVYLSLFFIGSLANYYSNQLNNSSHISYISSYEKLLVRVINPLEKKNKTYKTIISVEKAFKNDTPIKASGKVLLYINKIDFDSTIKYGDYLLINNKLRPPPTAIGKDSFNYSKWLSHKNIYHQAFLKRKDYQKTNINETNFIINFSYKTRSYLDNVLYHYLPDSSIYGVASAIILGIRSNINNDITQAYAHSGTIHILAVSGLHVGAIYLLLSLLLGFLGRYKRTLLLKAILTLVGLWLYALITGLSPSVIRATIMFSFIGIGNTLNRKISLFNSLAAAALFTLVIDANAIFQVGFQLSYLAVAGIGLFYAPLVKLLTPKIWLTGKVWQLLCVSFSAQLATAPLAIYYFHQFPNYFLISNLLIVPLSILSVYLGLLLLISPIPFVALLASKALYTVIYSTNTLVHKIEKIPFSYTSNLYINIWQLIFVYLSIISLFLYLIRKKGIYLIYFLVTLIIIILL